VFDCPAANGPGFQVNATVHADVEGPIKPAGEIDQVVWIDPHALPDLPFAPLTRDQVLPLARSLQ
jgi:8-oxo-dGTP diphosphatase